jgi:hypothetical protein
MRHLFIMFHPRFTTAHPISVIMVRRRDTGVTTTGYAIIVIAAVVIDPAMHAIACRISLTPQRFRQRDMIAGSSPNPRDTGKTVENTTTLAHSLLIEASGTAT